MENFLRSSKENILRTSRELLENVQVQVAHRLEEILASMPDTSARDRAIRRYLSKFAPCDVEDCYWSLVNAVDSDFSGYEAQCMRTEDFSKTNNTNKTTNESGSGGVNLHVVKNLALAAKLAYEDPPVIRHITKTWGMITDDTFFFEFGDTQAYIMYDDFNIVLCFRGTEFINPKDWQTDVKMTLLDIAPRKHVMQDGVHVKLNTPMAHAGFLEALGLHNHLTHDYVFDRNDNAYSQIHHVVSVLKIGTLRKLWVTGHSLGAALSSVFVAQMLLEEDEIVLDENFGGLYTFGQPRTGNAGYCDLFAKLEKRGRILRVVNNRDIVTHVPLTSAGYAHHGNKLYITEKGNIYYTYFPYDALPLYFDRRDKRNQAKRVISYHSQKKPGTSPTGNRKSPGKLVVSPTTMRKNSNLHAVVFALLPESMENHYPCDYIRHLEKSMY